MKTAMIAIFVVLAVAAAAALLFRETGPSPSAIAPPIESAERARAIDALRSGTTARPVIAIVTNNEGTEIADLLSTFGVLRQADVADVVVVAERNAPVHLYPSDLRAMPQASFAEFDRRHPGGADYVVVPAMEPPDNAAVMAWLLSQRRSGAKIVSVCNGSLTVGAAGLLDGRRATSHWSTVSKLRSQHPTMRWAEDRRYVSDGDITTATGITASVPLMLALVEAVGGRQIAEKTARDLGVEHWDARHVSAAFRLNGAHRWTFLRNKLSFWAKQEREVVVENADEIALGIAVDAYSRTELVSVVSTASQPQARSLHGLVLLPARVAQASALRRPLPALPRQAATTPRVMLERIEGEFDARTARYVALTLEYPW